MEDVTAVPAGGAVADGGLPLGAGAPADGGQQQQPQHTQAAPTGQQGGDNQNKVISIPTSAMKRIKDEEREKGRNDAINTLAKDAGFGSPLELVQALSALKNGGGQQRPAATTPQYQEPAPAQTQPQTPQQGQPNENGLNAEDLAASRNARREQGKYERMISNLTRERDTFAQKYQQASAQVKTYKDQLDSKDAEMSLREIAVQVGVTDVDYALRLYMRDVEGKSAEELSKLDERQYFEGLRKSKPYLFGEVVKPATTGPGPGGAPQPPKPGQVNQQNATNGQFDAKTATPQQIAERMRKMGLNSQM